MKLEQIKFSTAHKCTDNGLGDYDFFCPEKPEDKVCFLPFLVARTLSSKSRCQHCGNEIGEQIEVSDDSPT